MTATIEPAELQQRINRGERVDLIDVRTPVEYEQVHASGARLLPLDQLDVNTLASRRVTPMDQPVYLICKSGQRAAKGAQKLRSQGLEHVICVAGGTTAWQAASLPVETSSRKVISLERQVRIGAGMIVLLGIIGGEFAHSGFLALSAFAGAGLVFAGLTDWCGMGLLLAKAPWNQARSQKPVCCAADTGDANAGKNA